MILIVKCWTVPGLVLHFKRSEELLCVIDLGRSILYLRGGVSILNHDPCVGLAVLITRRLSSHVEFIAVLFYLPDYVHGPAKFLSGRNFFILRLSRSLGTCRL